MGAGMIAAGIIVGLLASCVQSLGLTIQRKSHVLNQALPLEQQRLEHRRPLWLLGFAIFLSSNILGSIFQIASLPVVILAPLGAVSLLWNAFFARILLGDGVSPWVVLGTLLIAAGAVLIGVFGIVPEPTHSLEDLLALFNRPPFIVYFSLLGFFCVVCLAITHIVEFSYWRRMRNDALQSPHPTPQIVATESSADLTTERTPLLDRKPPSSSAASITSSTMLLARARPSRLPLALALSYASHSGIISGMCLIFAKSGVELLLLTIGGDNQFWRWQAWMLLLGLVAFALLQLWYLHKALKLADPTLVCPLAFCFYNISSIVNGLVYYDQFSLLSSTQLALVLTGVIVLLCGVWAVSYQSIEIVPWAADAEAVTGAEDEAELADEVGPAPTLSRAASPPTHVHRRATTDVLIGSAVAVEEGEALGQSPPRPLVLGLGRPHRRYTTVGGPGDLSPPPAPGFSIGLSPVSPGFSLVPRGRRRRASVGMPGPRTPEGTRGGSEVIRRTVSDEHGQVWAWEEGSGNGDGRRTGDEEEGREEVREEVVRGAGRKRKSPWKLLKVLVGKRR